MRSSLIQYSPEHVSTPGSCKVGQGRFQAAVEHFEHALTLDPSLYPAYLDLSGAYADSGRLEAAVVALQRLRAIEPDDEVVLGKLGLMQARLGKYDEAIEAPAHAWELKPTDGERAILLARLLASAPNAGSRDVPRALDMAMDLYRIRPHDAGLADLLAMAYAAAGEFDKAIRLSERAIEIARNKPRLVHELRMHWICTAADGHSTCLMKVLRWPSTFSASECRRHKRVRYTRVDTCQGQRIPSRIYESPVALIVSSIE